MIERNGRLEAFGFEPTTAHMKVIERPTSWRMSRSLLSAAVGLGAAPVVFLVPPHVPWALASLGAGVFFARRFAIEKVTLVEMHGTCPKCGAAVAVEKPVPMRQPHEISCPECLQGLLLVGGFAEDGGGRH